MEDIETQVRATLQTRCYRPGCKGKHPAKFKDSVKALTELVEERSKQKVVDELTRLVFDKNHHLTGSGGQVIPTSVVIERIAELRRQHD